MEGVGDGSRAPLQKSGQGVTAAALNRNAGRVQRLTNIQEVSGGSIHMWDMWGCGCVAYILSRNFIWYISKLRERFLKNSMSVVKAYQQLERIKYHQTEIRGGRRELYALLVVFKNDADTRENVIEVICMLKNVELSHGSAILLLGVYPKEVKTRSQRDIYITMYTAALFITAKRQKQPK